MTCEEEDQSENLYSNTEDDFGLFEDLMVQNV